MRKNHSTATAYIGVGSNLGDRESNLRRAIALLVETPGMEVRRISSFLENQAVGGPDDAPLFLNAAVEGHVTSITPETLMRRLLDIEVMMGRVRHTKWEPRVVDLDLLLFGDQIIGTDKLIVPHPLMHERRFVLQPLAEIAPEVTHPTLQVSIRGLLENLMEQHRGQPREVEEMN